MPDYSKYSKPDVVEKLHDYCRQNNIPFNPETGEGFENFFIQNKLEGNTCVEGLAVDDNNVIHQVNRFAEALTESNLCIFELEKDRIRTPQLGEGQLIVDKEEPEFPKLPNFVQTVLNRVNQNFFADKVEAVGNQLQDAEQNDILNQAIRNIVLEREPSKDKIYVHPEKTSDQLNGENRQKHQRSAGIPSIRNTIKQYKPNAYGTIDAIRTSKDEGMRESKLHSGHARMLREKKDAGLIIRVDLAGSGFSQFRAQHRGFKGKNGVEIMGKTFKLQKDFEKQIKPRAEVSWYNTPWLAKALKRVPFVGKRIRTAGEIQRDNRIAENKEKVIEALEKKKEEFERYYGTMAVHKEKAIEHFCVAESDNRVNVTIAGAMALSGMRNSGAYSIENTREYVLGIVGAQLEKKFKDWKENEEEPKDIHLMLRGHSRGAVSAVESAMYVKSWVHDNYPEYEKNVKFNLLQYEPVAGLGSNNGVHANVDCLGEQELLHGAAKLRPLGDSVESTVFYSLHADHNVGFTPQAVQGAKRVILTPFRHNTGFDQVDTAKTKDRDGKEQIDEIKTILNEENAPKAHRMGFTDARTGEVYMGNSINMLDEGIYVVDEQNTLIRLESKEEANKVLNALLPNTVRQRERHDIIRHVTEQWFERPQKEPEEPSKPVKPLEPKLRGWVSFARKIKKDAYKQEYDSYKEKLENYKKQQDQYEKDAKDYRQYNQRKEMLSEKLKLMISDTKQTLDLYEHIIVKDKPLSELLHEDYARKQRGNSLDQTYEAYQKTELYHKRAMALMLADSKNADWKVDLMSVDNTGKLKDEVIRITADETNLIKETTQNGKGIPYYNQMRELEEAKAQAKSAGISQSRIDMMTQFVSNKKLAFAKEKTLQNDETLSPEQEAMERKLSPEEKKKIIQGLAEQEMKNVKEKNVHSPQLQNIAERAVNGFDSRVV